MSDNKRMHEHETEVSLSLVKELISTQFPQWTEPLIVPVKSMGTDNAMYRLGADLCVRLPRIFEASQQLERELHWLPYLASHLPLAIPVPYGMGNPCEHYPFDWAIYQWLEGENAFVQLIGDQRQAAADLAQFLQVLHRIDATQGPLARRGMPLVTQDHSVQQALDFLRNVIDVKKAESMWKICLQAHVWDRPAVWLHGDLLPANLLVHNDRLSAVIDFGLSGIGDPACDLIPAWSLFSHDAREIFRMQLGVDDATWMRGKGWALSIALIILPYYQHSNSDLVTVAHHMLREIFEEQ